MRMSHVAYTVKNREESVNFFVENFGFRMKEERDDGFFVLEPSEKSSKETCHKSIRQFVGYSFPDTDHIDPGMFAEFHTPPEILISQGKDFGIHHVAYEVDEMESIVAKFKKFGLKRGGCSLCGSNSFILNRAELSGVALEFFKS